MKSNKVLETASRGTESFPSFLLKTVEAYSSYAAAFGIDVYELFILAYLYDHRPDCSRREMIEESRLPSKSVDSILKSFTKSGVIEFLPDDVDKRGKRIRLSEVGEDCAKKAVGGIREVEDAARKLLGEKQWKEIFRLNGELLNAFNQALKELKP